VDDELDVEDLFRQRFRKDIRSGKISLVFAHSGEEALAVLSTLSPMDIVLILSDINMPGMTGIELKKILQEDPYLASKGVPFVFISTNATRVSVRHAHALSVQGYFEKPQHVDGLRSMFKTLFDYWELCKHINNT
jgi:CheY-like chemotaxis protein